MRVPGQSTSSSTAPSPDVAVLVDAIDDARSHRALGEHPLIGTTDDDTYADLDDLPPPPTRRYLVEGVEQVLARPRGWRASSAPPSARAPRLQVRSHRGRALPRAHEG